MTKPYSVILWGSHPDEDNDDAMTGEDFATATEARAAFDDPQAFFGDTAHGNAVGGWAYWADGVTHVQIDGPDVHEVRQIVSNAEIVRRKRQDARSDEQWLREIAMQAGMGLGVDAYNDEMGWG